MVTQDHIIQALINRNTDFFLNETQFDLTNDERYINATFEIRVEIETRPIIGKYFTGTYTSANSLIPFLVNFEKLLMVAIRFYAFYSGKMVRNEMTHPAPIIKQTSSEMAGKWYQIIAKILDNKHLTKETLNDDGFNKLTALQYATKNNLTEIVELLIEKTEDKLLYFYHDGTRHYHESPFKMAEANKSTDITKLLLRHLSPETINEINYEMYREDGDKIVEERLGLDHIDDEKWLRQWALILVQSESFGTANNLKMRESRPLIYKKNIDPRDSAEITFDLYKNDVLIQRSTTDLSSISILKNTGWKNLARKIRHVLVNQVLKYNLLEKLLILIADTGFVWDDVLVKKVMNYGLEHNNPSIVMHMLLKNGTIDSLDFIENKSKSWLESLKSQNRTTAIAYLDGKNPVPLELLDNYYRVIIWGRVVLGGVTYKSGMALDSFWKFNKLMQEDKKDADEVADLILLVIRNRVENQKNGEIWADLYHALENFVDYHRAAQRAITRLDSAWFRANSAKCDDDQNFELRCSYQGSPISIKCNLLIFFTIISACDKNNSDWSNLFYQILPRIGKSIDHCDSNVNTALYYASRNVDSRKVSALLQHGANPMLLHPVNEAQIRSIPYLFPPFIRKLLTDGELIYIFNNKPGLIFERLERFRVALSYLEYEGITNDSGCLKNLNEKNNIALLKAWGYAVLDRVQMYQIHRDTSRSHYVSDQERSALSAMLEETSPAPLNLAQLMHVMLQKSYAHDPNKETVWRKLFLALSKAYPELSDEAQHAIEKGDVDWFLNKEKAFNPNRLYSLTLFSPSGEKRETVNNMHLMEIAIKYSIMYTRLQNAVKAKKWLEVANNAGRRDLGDAALVEVESRCTRYLLVNLFKTEKGVALHEIELHDLSGRTHHSDDDSTSANSMEMKKF
ncbi:MAG: hypothetical protein ACHQAX_09915 [Gammaproteobacteria bacterium]